MLPESPAGTLVAGVDEAGRGCLAGPVVAAAVILPSGFSLPGLTDSKKLSPLRRERFAQVIKAQAMSWALGFSWPGEIDRINILKATLRAMARAVAVLPVRPGFILVDGNQTFPAAVPVRAVVGGDALHPCISAASVLAKTFRDRLMAHMDARHPGYGLAVHKGYGTKRHFEALARLGPSSAHRLSFRGVVSERKRDDLCLPGI